MAVDHGLEGRNSEKSRQRRERKSRRLKKLVQATLKQGDANGRRGEIKFDETARQAWLSGFGNRKQERRKFGLTMQVRAATTVIPAAARYYVYGICSG